MPVPPYPTFSLLMPTLCRSSLAAAIDAVRAQTYTYWELVICPPCKVVSDDPRIKLINGPEFWPDKLNHMVSVATGSVFAIAADDDLLDPVALSAVATYLRHNPWLVGRIRTNGRIMGGPCTQAALLHDNLIPLPATFWTRDAAIATGPFSSEHPFCLDWDYWIRMWKAVGPPKFISNVLCDYRDHPGQVTHMQPEAVRADAEAVSEEWRTKFSAGDVGGQSEEKAQIPEIQRARWSRRITKDEALEIRRLLSSGLSIKNVSVQYGVSYAVIWSIATGRSHSCT